jgi:glycerol-3-phosphate dehydrogenase subunit B
VNTVLVVGAGVAGTAAAISAARAGARVTLVDGGTGASTLATGALDAIPWQMAAAQPHRAPPISNATRETIALLGGYSLPDAGATLLTSAGLSRPARGHDAALLDIQPIAGTPIGVVGCDRPGWDAGALARSWGGDFVLVDAALLRHVDERSLPDADFAMRHDDEGRLAWLAARLREALALVGGGVGALVLPPCLGVERARAEALSELVGVRCGEAIGAPGGPAGFRFEKARDRAVANAHVARVGRRATTVAQNGNAWRVTMEDAHAADADAVVLATGGLIGGGFEYSPSEAFFASALPPFSRRPFQLTLDAPAVLGANGVELELPSTLFGRAPESIAWPFVPDALMDRVGVLASADGHAGRGLFAAGDVVADRPRAWLYVFAMGIAAGVAAARWAAQG